MHLVIVSGLSGAGKSVALHMLEDLGYYCIDNIPAALLKSFISHAVRSGSRAYERTAIGLDARNTDAEIASVPTLVDDFRRSGIDCEVLFLVASDTELLRRFAETRRAHPMARQGESLPEAIAKERELLHPVAERADQVIDTSQMGVHELRELVQSRSGDDAAGRLIVVVESFGYKHGIPGDADLVFDARALPNPYWDKALRPLTGQDTAVQRFLAQEPLVGEFIDDTARYIEARLPLLRASTRRYVTVAVGCTGGQHRSVYIAERLAEKLAAQAQEVRVRHTAMGAAASAAGALR